MPTISKVWLRENDLGLGENPEFLKMVQKEEIVHFRDKQQQEQAAKNEKQMEQQVVQPGLALRQKRILEEHNFLPRVTMPNLMKIATTDTQETSTSSGSTSTLVAKVSVVCAPAISMATPLAVIQSYPDVQHNQSPKNTDGQQMALSSNHRLQLPTLPTVQQQQSQKTPQFTPDQQQTIAQTETAVATLQPSSQLTTTLPPTTVSIAATSATLGIRPISVSIVAAPFAPNIASSRSILRVSQGGQRTQSQLPMGLATTVPDSTSLSKTNSQLVQIKPQVQLVQSTVHQVPNTTGTIPGFETVVANPEISASSVVASNLSSTVVSSPSKMMIIVHGTPQSSKPELKLKSPTKSSVPKTITTSMASLQETPGLRQSGLTPAMKLQMVQNALAKHPSPQVQQKLLHMETGFTTHPSTQKKPGHNRIVQQTVKERRKNYANTETHRTLLFKHTELLKKYITKKRDLVWDDMKLQIQKELQENLAKRESMTSVSLLLSKQQSSTQVKLVEANKIQVKQTKISKVSVKVIQQASTFYEKEEKTIKQPIKRKSQSSESVVGGRSYSLSKSIVKKLKLTIKKPTDHKALNFRKLYCICKKPYDSKRFMISCDMCSNWFHVDCIQLTMAEAENMNNYVCDECGKATENAAEELYCMCRQPYNDSRFYVCCDQCQDWFHGRCVGVLQSEAKSLAKYICPNCRSDTAINHVNFKQLDSKDYEAIKRLLKSLMSHKHAWPFMKAVDPIEEPDYYKYIKEPMDLETVEKKLNGQFYKRLVEFIGDIATMFDNCRYYNQSKSRFYKCADILEEFFVREIRAIRKTYVMP